MEEWVDKWVDGWVNGWMDDGWMNEGVDTCIKEIKDQMADLTCCHAAKPPSCLVEAAPFKNQKRKTHPVSMVTNVSF